MKFNNKNTYYLHFSFPKYPY